jgi:hypothetical protein
MQWSREIYHFEEAPPPGIWERINFELDNNISGVRNSLKNYTVDPPPAVWTAVQHQLREKDPETKLVWYKKTSNLIAAASLTGIIFLAIFLVSKRDQIKASDIATSIHSPEIPVHDPGQKTSPGQVTVPQVESGSATQLQIIAKSSDNISEHRSENRAEQADHKNYSLATIDIEVKPGEISIPGKLYTNRDYHLLQSVQFQDGNYIHIISPDGNVKRVSYKLQEMIPAIKDEYENILLKKWKEKIQTSAFIPSGNNFFDLADMLNMLKEY